MRGEHEGGEGGSGWGERACRQVKGRWEERVARGSLAQKKKKKRSLEETNEYAAPLPTSTLFCERDRGRARADPPRGCEPFSGPFHTSQARPPQLAPPLPRTVHPWDLRPNAARTALLRLRPSLPARLPHLPRASRFSLRPSTPHRARASRRCTRVAGPKLTQADPTQADVRLGGAEETTRGRRDELTKDARVEPRPDAHFSRRARRQPRPRASAPTSHRPPTPSSPPRTPFRVRPPSTSPIPRRPRAPARLPSSRRHRLLSAPPTPPPLAGTERARGRARARWGLARSARRGPPASSHRPRRDAQVLKTSFVRRPRTHTASRVRREDVERLPKIASSSSSGSSGGAVAPQRVAASMRPSEEESITPIGMRKGCASGPPTRGSARRGRGQGRVARRSRGRGKRVPSTERARESRDATTA